MAVLDTGSTFAQQHRAPLGSPAFQDGVGALSKLQDAAASKLECLKTAIAS